MGIVEIVGGIVALYFLKRWLAWSAPPETLLSMVEAKEWIKKEKGLQILDVRSPEEFSQGHLVKAVSLPLGELGRRQSDLDKGQPVLVYCRFGSRSATALRVLLRQGFAAKLLVGGFSAWKDLGYPVELDPGKSNE